jgi:hypothetical protein
MTPPADEVVDDAVVLAGVAHAVAAAVPFGVADDLDAVIGDAGDGADGDAEFVLIAARGTAHVLQAVRVPAGHGFLLPAA